MTSWIYPPVETGGGGGDVNMGSTGAYGYDSSRDKTLSADHKTYTFYDDEASSSYLVGRELMDSDGTIVAVSANGTGNDTKGFEVHINGSSALAFSLTGGTYKSDTVDVDVSEGDLLRVFCVGSGGLIYNPSVTVEVAKRQ